MTPSTTGPTLRDTIGRLAPGTALRDGKGSDPVTGAAVAVPELYAGERLALEFTRTQSRLLEMQSEEYLARGHRP